MCLGCVTLQEDVSLCDAKFVLKLDGTLPPPPPHLWPASCLPSITSASSRSCSGDFNIHHPNLICCFMSNIVLTIPGSPTSVINHFHSQLCIYLCWHPERLYWHNWHRHHHHVYHVRAAISSHNMPTRVRPSKVVDCRSD